MFKVAVPQIDVNGVSRGSLSAPHFACRKTPGIQVLRLFALKMRIGVGEDEDAMIAIDDAGPAPCVAWQARMSRRVHHSRSHPIANFKASFGTGIGPRIIAS